MSTTRTSTDGDERTQESPLRDEAFLNELDEEFVPLVRGLFRLFKDETIGTSAAGIFVLGHIESLRKATTKEVARVTHITTAGASQILAQLIENGLVRRERSEEDHRVFNLVVTTRGKELLAENRSAHMATLLRVFSCLQGGERAELVRILRKVRANNPELA